jgi:hypothetical protein
MYCLVVVLVAEAVDALDAVLAETQGILIFYWHWKAGGVLSFEIN